MTILAAGLLVYSIFGPKIVDPIPADYTGPTAVVRDTSTQRDDTAAADIFCLEQVAGNAIDNSLLETQDASHGNGPVVILRMTGRRVPAQQATFVIHGLNYYAAPVQEIFNKTYDISGEISFTPLPDHSYEVKGALMPGYSAVWIEDTGTLQVMDHKIEKGTPPAP